MIKRFFHFLASFFLKPGESHVEVPDRATVRTMWIYLKDGESYCDPPSKDGVILTGLFIEENTPETLCGVMEWDVKIQLHHIALASLTIFEGPAFALTSPYPRPLLVPHLIGGLAPHALGRQSISVKFRHLTEQGGDAPTGKCPFTLGIQALRKTPC